MKRLARTLIFLLICYTRASYASVDPFDGDSRLLAHRDLRMAQVAVRDIVAEIGLQTGVQFYVENSAADDRVTVISHDRPYADILKNVAIVFGDIWVASTTNKIVSYTLKRSPELEKIQRDVIRKRAEQRVRWAFQEVSGYSEMMKMTESDRDSLMGSLPGLAASAANPDEKMALQLKLTALQQTAEGGSRGQWVPVIYRFLEAMPESERQQLLRQEVVSYSYPSVEGANRIPESVIERVRKAIRVTSSVITPSGGSGSSSSSTVRIKFTQNRGSGNYFRWEISSGQRYGQYVSSTRYNGQIPSIIPAENEKIAAEDYSSLHNDPSLARKVSLHLPVVTVPDKFLSDINQRALLVSDVLAEIDKIVPINVVADAFWSGRLAALDVRDAAVSDALIKTARQSARKITAAHGFVNMVSEKIAEDRDQEPPSTSIARWRELAEAGTFTVDELSEIATLSESQSQTLLEMASWGAFPMVYQGLYQARSHLQFWSILKASQRRDAQAGGITYSSLSEDQKKLYQAAISDPSGTTYATTGNDLGNIQRSSLKVTIQEYPGWYVYRNGVASTYRLQRGPDSDNGAVTREEALKRFRQLEQSIGPKDVLAMVRTVVVFTYSTKDGTLSRSAFELPLRRETGE